MEKVGAVVDGRDCTLLVINCEFGCEDVCRMRGVPADGPDWEIADTMGEEGSRVDADFCGSNEDTEDCEVAASAFWWKAEVAETATDLERTGIGEDEVEGGHKGPRAAH